jgi:hypothetical protein
MPYIVPQRALYNNTIYNPCKWICAARGGQSVGWAKGGAGPALAALYRGTRPVSSSVALYRVVHYNAIVAL